MPPDSAAGQMAEESRSVWVTFLLKILDTIIQYIPSWLATCVSYQSQTKSQELLILLNNTEQY